jgi:hypothetical protein
MPPSKPKARRRRLYGDPYWKQTIIPPDYTIIGVTYHARTRVLDLYGAEGRHQIRAHTITLGALSRAQASALVARLKDGSVTFQQLLWALTRPRPSLTWTPEEWAERDGPSAGGAG